MRVRLFSAYLYGAARAALREMPVWRARTPESILAGLQQEASTMSQVPPRRLSRSRRERMLGGVSAGLAAYFDIDPVIVRLAWVLGTVFSGGAVAIAYVVLWAVVPDEGYAGPPSDVVRENVNSMASEARRMAEDVRDVFRGPSSTAPGSQSTTGPSAESMASTAASSTVPAGEAMGPTTESTVYTVTDEPVADIPDSTQVVELPPEPTSTMTPYEVEMARRHRAVMGGVIILVLGLILLAGNVGLGRWINWNTYWPVLLVVLGAFLLWNHSRARN
jgi:phage shock protein C